MRKLSYNRAPRWYKHILRIFRTKQEPSRASWAFSFPNHFASWALFSCPLEAHFVVQGPLISGEPPLAGAGLSSSVRSCRLALPVYLCPDDLLLCLLRRLEPASSGAFAAIFKPLPRLIPAICLFVLFIRLVFSGQNDA